MTDVIKVFVYGTLMQGEYNHYVVEPFVQTIVPGAIKGRLYTMGAFPAVVIDDSDGYSIAGEWIETNERGLKAMDRLEGYRGPGKNNFYDRIEVQDISGHMTGWVYVLKVPENLKEIINGSWKNRFHQE